MHVNPYQRGYIHMKNAPPSDAQRARTTGRDLMRNFFWVLGLLFLWVPQTSAQPTSTASAMLYDTAGNNVGQALFFQGTSGVGIGLSLVGLPPGPHAVHFHTVGACTPNFLAAKGHINPNNRRHGLMNSDGPDHGDLPNILVGQDGTAQVEMHSSWVSITLGPVALLDRDGSALVIHAKGDDHESQPIGGAGGRIACGVIVQN